MNQTKTKSELTVLMTVYNGSDYLQTAMDSILRQTYRDFCFLIVDDASTDDSRDIIKSYDDDRIQLICLEKNIGQTAALNYGLRQAVSPWIARMDADDYSAPTRLEEQMRTLDADSSLSCVGTHVWIFYDDPEIADSVIATPIHHTEITNLLLKGTPIIHGSIVVSREAILDVGAFDERYKLTADVDMYDRLLTKYRAANIPKSLVGVRRHENQISHSRLVFDESIAICCRRLSETGYSKQEAKITKGNLARSYLFRARILGGQYKFFELSKDIARALRVSPNTFLRDLPLVFASGLIPQRRHAAIRRILNRVIPTLSK